MSVILASSTLATATHWRPCRSRMRAMAARMKGLSSTMRTSSLGPMWSGTATDMSGAICTPYAGRRSAGARSASRQERQQVLAREAGAERGVAEGSVDEPALLRLQGQDTLLDGIGRHEAVDRHRSLLSDPVRAVGGLVLDGRVPPQIAEEHMVGGREVQAAAARLERHEHDGRALV